MHRRYRTDEIIPQTGVYYVFHEQHRLIRTVRLFSGDRFPRCSKCRDQVKFELLLEMSDFGQDRIHLYQLEPRIKEEEEEAR